MRSAKSALGKRPSVRTRSLGLPGASKTLDFEMPPDSPDRDAFSHHTPEVQDRLDDALLAAAAAHSSAPSPDKTILTPIALIFLDSKYMGVDALIVVTSKVSR